MAKTILAVDPGSRKCGIAVVTSEGVLHREVTSRSRTAEAVTHLAAAYPEVEIIMGNGTGSASLARELEVALDLPITLVDETNSTYRARARFFQDNPPRGIRRLIPRGLLAPDHPYDDYIAVLLAEEYLRGA